MPCATQGCEREAKMTDREAIQRLAGIVSDLFEQTSEHSFSDPSMHRALAVEAARLVSGLAEPDAPAVTRREDARLPNGLICPACGGSRLPRSR